MAQFTKAQIKTKIEQSLDLQEEIFIEPTELDEYINDGIREAEAVIHTIYEDYMLTKESIPLTAGQSDFDLPADIYANKIRSLIYNDGTETYQLKRVRQFKDIPLIDVTELYLFLITNSSASGTKLTLFPVSRVTHPTALTCWYLRQAKQLVNDSDVCDIPEFMSFVIQHAKVRCMEKEGHPLLDNARTDLERQRQLMTETLTAMVVDEDNKVLMDTGIYEELS